MAHFAELNENGVVLRVIVVSNQNCTDANGDEVEALGAAFCHNLLGGTWKQTSYNDRIRKHFAGIGMVYDQALDAFIPPKPYTSWLLNTDTCQWQSPVPMPTDGPYSWDESTLSWVAIQAA